MSVDFDAITYTEARSIKDSLDVLTKSDGWKFVLELLEERSKIRQTELLQLCPESVEQMVRYARVKGGIDELKLFGGLIEYTYSTLVEVIQDMQSQDQDAELDLDLDTENETADNF